MKVVTTDVGGIPEVLPPSLIHLCSPDPKEIIEVRDLIRFDEQSSLCICVSLAVYCPVCRQAVVEEVEAPQWPEEQLWENHRLIEKMYAWGDVAERTVRRTCGFEEVFEIAWVQ